MAELSNGVVREQLLVDGVTIANGVLEGGAVVSGELVLGGTCSGTLLIQDGGFARIGGVMSGTLRIASGGEVWIGGAINGQIDQQPGGRVIAAVGAHIGGQELRPDGSLGQPRGSVVSEDSPRCERLPDGSWRPLDD